MLSEKLRKLKKMADGYNFEQLKARISELSAATNWETVRKEWHLTDIYMSDEPETCLCGHFPIREICVITNRITGHSAEVGNRCVKRFLGFRSDLIFAAVKRIRLDMEKSLNSDAIAFFKEQRVINVWEYGFLQDTQKKRNLSIAQLRTRIGIKKKVLASLNKSGIRSEY